MAVAEVNGSRQYRTVRKRLSTLKPSPENLELYRSAAEDPDILKLAESIKKHGLHEPLIVTEDNFIVSGHRRYAAMQYNNQQFAPCRVLPIKWANQNNDERVALLREHNLQRRKSVAEQIREAMVDTDPNVAMSELVARRQEMIDPASRHSSTISIEGDKHRHAISDQKAAHVKYVRQVVFEDRKDYWPLSVRAIHYALLNYTFMRNIPRGLRYINDDKSYQATSDLLTRMRLTGDIPWDCLTDGTRPVTTYRPFDDVREFISQQTDGFLCGYWRDLMQSQTCHFEVLCEKNTVYHMVCRVTEGYQIVTSSGRGFNSIDPWHEMACRYRESGKERLIVIVLSDYDPEGEQIPQVGGRTLRDDFGLLSDEFSIIKAGVTREQIQQYNLPAQNFAKETSPSFDWFLSRNCGDTSVYELEALDPQQMMGDLEEIIKSVIDIDAFNGEIANEEQESVYLACAREKGLLAMKGLLD